MELTIFERANLLSILPTQGDFITLNIVHGLRKKVAMTEEEHRLYQPSVSDDGVMRWRTKDDAGNPLPEDKTIELSEIETGMIAKELSRLDKEKKLRIEHYELYLKFCQPQLKG